MFTTFLYAIEAIQIIFIIIFIGMTAAESLVWSAHKKEKEFKSYIKGAAMANLKFLLYADGFCMLVIIILFLVQ